MALTYLTLACLALLFEEASARGRSSSRSYSYHSSSRYYGRNGEKQGNPPWVIIGCFLFVWCAIFIHAMCCAKKKKVESGDDYTPLAGAVT